MKVISLLVAPLLYCIATNALVAELKRPGPSPSDALFDPSRVIQIEIRLDPKDWLALRISHPEIDENFRVTARGYEYYRADVVIDGKLVKSVGVPKKGTGSEDTGQPAFKIKFNEYMKNREFSGLDMLTLNNLNEDPSKAQQSLVYSFMNKAGAISPRSNLVRISVNGEDLGIYGHVESIDRRFIKRHFGNAQGDLYEGQYGADFTTNDFKKVIHKWGPDDDLAEVRKLVDLLEAAGPVQLKRIEELVDLDAFITFWAATVLICNSDSYVNNRNNCYFYRDVKSGKFFLFPWGADAWSLAAGVRDKDVPRSFWADGHLCRRLWELPEIRERYRKEMRRLLAEVWNEKSMLSELQQISQFCQNDLPNSRRARSTDRIAQFIDRQRAAVQAELDGPAVDWPFPRREWGLELKKPNGPPMQVEGSFTAVVAGAFPTNAAGYFGQGAATLQFTVAGETRKPFTRSGAIMVKDQAFTMVEIVLEDAAGDLRRRLRFFWGEFRACAAETRQN